MNIRYDGLTVAVTGAGHGFGQCIARSFDALGARVFACDLSASELETTRQGTGMTTDAFDLTAKGAAFDWIKSVESRSGGPIGVLVCNAGGVRGQTNRPIEDVPEADWHAIFDINTHAAFNMARAVVPGMKKAGGGRIVTISSGAGIKASRTGIQAYCAAKHALVGLTRQLSKELGQFGITVNSVAPGFVLSNPTTIVQYDSYGEAGKAAMLQGISMRRLGTVEDITHGVLFLASPFASYVTGQVLSVDGGT